MPVTAPADRRFLRAQVKPGRRQAPWRPWLRALRVLLVVVIGLGGGAKLSSMAVHAPVFAVSHVSIVGNHRLSTGEVLALLDGLAGQNILLVRLEQLRARVCGCPWVRDAVVRRVLPSTIEITVTERQPIAIGRIGEDLFLVDERGTVIDEYGPRYADLDLPILDGLAAGAGEDPAVNERRAQLATRLLGAVRSRPDLAKRISQLDVSDPRNAVVIVDQDATRLRLGDDRFLERLQSVLRPGAGAARPGAGH